MRFGEARVRVPKSKYEAAKQLQDKYRREQGYCPPLWWCMIQVEQENPMEEFRRFKF